MREKLRFNIIKFAKKILRIPQNQSLSFRNFQKYLRLYYGPIFYKEKISTSNILEAMKNMGMTEGSNVFIHCSWDEFYNYEGSEEELIDAILNVIGQSGTLIMPAFPLLKSGKIFNVKKTVTSAGMFAEIFRKYPGVKRSINIQHSVCAFGPQADFLLSEHHLGETCWDEKSPYYKLSQINTLVFSLGLRKYYIGAMVHCVESILRKEVPYYASFFKSEPTWYNYVLNSGNEILQYKHYELADGKYIRISKHLGTAKITKKYFNPEFCCFSKVSNLRISMYRANLVIPKMIELGRKGIDIYKYPRKKHDLFKPF